jgi:transcriptional regulator with XRE-family HTH domain
MVTMDAVKEIMKRKGVRPSDLCEGLGIKSNVLSERFKQKNVSVSKLNEMLRLMNYKIVLTPDDKELDEDSIEVE